MKVWTKVKIKDKNKDLVVLSKSLTNYLYSPILDIYRKYNISREDRAIIDKYTTNRIAGLLLLYMTKDFDRINDIANKYNLNDNITNITPEIETYINK